MEEKLIQFIRENRLLYNKKHPSYRNQILKNIKWLAFSQEIDVPVDTLKKRWKSMRDRFYRVRKSDASVSSGSGQKSPDRRIAYKYYESLQFLCDVGTSNMSTFDNFEQYNEAAESLCCSEESLDMDEASCSTFCISETPYSIPATAPRKRKRADVENEKLNILKTMKSSAAQSVTPFRVFLESVALTVESASCSFRQITRLQMNILQLVQDEIENNFK